MLAGTDLHKDTFVMDGLVYHSDGNVDDLRAGHIDALNITVCHFEADFAGACGEIARWHGILAAPNTPWMRIEKATDFDAARAAGKIGLIMGWQNTRPIADELDRLYFFRQLGLRIMQLTYNYRNALGDGCLEPEEGGLTLLGHQAVEIMNELGIAIDLSHVGQRTMLDTIECSKQPVLITHANARSVAKLERNKTDDVIRTVAEKGGVIGASIYGPMCWDQDPGRKPTITDYLRHLDYLVEIAGPEHIGFGTDLATGSNFAKMASERGHWRRWEGINRFNRIFGEEIPERYLSDCNKHSDLPKVTEALLARGWSEEHVRGYLGGNFRRVLDRIWSANS